MLSILPAVPRVLPIQIYALVWRLLGTRYSAALLCTFDYTHIFQGFYPWHRCNLTNPQRTHPKPKKQLSSRNRYRKMLAMPFERNTVECRYNAVQCNMVLHTPLQQVRQNINEKLSPQKIHHMSPYYGVYFVNVWEKDDLVIMAPLCTTIK